MNCGTIRLGNADILFSPKVNCLGVIHDAELTMQCMLVYGGPHGMAASYIADMCVKRSFKSEHYIVGLP